MARTNRHMVLVRALVPRINSRIPIWFPPGARNQNAELQVLRSSKGGNGSACADSGAKYNGVYENRICTPLPSSLRIAQKGGRASPRAAREILGGHPRYADSNTGLEILE
jgi:hypothetical protein